MADDADLTEMRALAERAANAAYDRWSSRPNRAAYVSDLARRAARAAVDTVAPLLVEQGRRQVLTELERDAVGRDPEPWETVSKTDLADWARLMREGADGPWPSCGCRCLACGGDFAGHCIHQGTHPVAASEWATEARDALRRLLGPLPKPAEPLSCGCPPEHHDEAVRRAGDPAERRALLARLTQQSLELGTYDKRVTEES